MDSVICVADKIEWLASITIHPALRQRLQNRRQLMEGAPNQTHTLVEWVDTAICSTWSNTGECPDTVSK